MKDRPGSDAPAAKSSRGELWVPASYRPEAQRASDSVMAFVPHDAVFPELPADFKEFKRLLRSLSRTDTIFWCARLNILVSDSDLNAIEVQSKCLRVFLNDQQLNRVNVFAYQHGGADRVRIFFRGQLLELMRWVALFCVDQPDDGTTFNQEEVRRNFARAALVASDIWGRRIFGDRFDGERTVAERRNHALPAIRRMSVENASCPDPLFQITRGASLFADGMSALAPDMGAAFLKATGLSVEDHFCMLARIAADGLFVVRTANGFESLQDSTKGGLFSVSAYESAGEAVSEIVRVFFANESQTADELRKALWGARTDADEESDGSFDLKALRERPIFRASDGRAIILEPRFFVERGSAGPLFYLVRGRRSEQQRWFALFGEVFEDYAQGILARMYPDAGGLNRRFHPKPKTADLNGHAVALNDGLLVGIDSFAIIEMKAAWTPDSAAGPDTETSAYLAELRARYGISTAPRDGDRPVKGLGQLARSIQNLSSGAWTVAEPSVEGLRTAFPILLVHDPHVDAPLHSHFLAREFAGYLGVHQPERDGWARMKIGRLDVSHVVILTLDDLERLESSTQHFSFLDCLSSYDQACPDRLMSFHNFLATSSYRAKLRSNVWLADRCLELLARCQSRLFPDSGA